MTIRLLHWYKLPSNLLVRQPSLQQMLLAQNVRAITATTTKSPSLCSTLRFVSTTTATTPTQNFVNLASPAQTQQLQIRIQLFQYRICPFCNRVKTVLDYIMNHSTDTTDGNNNIQMAVEHIEVNPITKSEIQQFSKEYRKVPIAVFTTTTIPPSLVLSNDDSDDTVPQSEAVPMTNSIPPQTTTVFGSDEIIQHLLVNDPTIMMMVRQKLEQRWMKQQQLLSSSSSERMTYDKFINRNVTDDTSNTSTIDWSSYATNELAVWLYPNMCRSYSDSFKAFNYIHDPTLLHFTTLQRYTIQYIGALAMTFAASKIKKRHNVKDERQALENVLMKLETELLRLNPTTTKSKSDTTTANSNDAASRSSSSNNDNKFRFLSGTELPNIDDLNVYGVLRAIQDLPIYKKVIIQRDGNPNIIAQWAQSMSNEVLGVVE